MKDYLYEDLYLLENKHWWHVTKRNLCLRLLKDHKNAKNLKILDVGCGTGKNLEFFSKIGTVWGIDNSPQALKYCRKRGFKNIKLCQADKTPFKNASFDVITLLDVLEHTDDNKALKEMFRILKPDGILIITVPAFQWLWSRWDIVLHHKRRYSITNLTEVLQKHNFIAKKSSYMYSYLIIPVFLVRLVKTYFITEEYPSDFKLSSSLINNTMLRINSLETLIIEKVGLPFGTSVICLARKNEQTRIEQ